MKIHCFFLFRYFDEIEDDSTPSGSDLAYIPAPGSPSCKMSQNDDSDSEEDPLDAFMAGIEKQVFIFSLLTV